MQCHGQFVGLAVVREYGEANTVKRLWFEAQARPKHPLGCPACRKAMQMVMLTPRIEIDLCRSCQSLWFDPDEFSHLPPRTSAPARPKPAPATKRYAPMPSRNSDTPVFDTAMEPLFDVIDALDYLS